MTAGRLTRTTPPEGNYVQLTYDAPRQRHRSAAVSKTPGTPADIVTTASYPASCTNPDLQPAEQDHRRPATVTDYTYDATHGGVLTVTVPAPDRGRCGRRPAITLHADATASKSSR